MKKSITALILTISLLLSGFTAFAIDDIPLLENSDPFIEKLDPDELPFDVEDLQSQFVEEEFPEYRTADERRQDDTFIPLQITFDQSNKLSFKFSTSADALRHEVYILDGETELLYHDTNAFKELSQKSVVNLQPLSPMVNNKAYGISLVVTYADTIESYDGTFTIVNNQSVFGPIFYNSAPLSALLSASTPKATTYESESNNTYSIANTYIDNNDMYGLISSATDRDWYRVKFDLDGNANFFLGYIPTGCNYNLKIYSATTQYSTPTLRYSCMRSGNVNELLENFAVDSNLYYYMEVYSAQGFNTTSRYQVRARNYPITDAYEPNNTRATAKTVSANTTITATIHKVADQDWYKFYTSGSFYEFKLSSIPYGTNYQLELYNNSGTLLGSSTNTGTTQENIAINLASGYYCVKVYSASGFNISSKYSLTIYPRSNSFTFNVYLAPKIADRYGGTVAARYLQYVPYKLYAVRSDNYEYLVSSGETSSSGYISRTATLPTGNYTKWRIKFELDNSDIKAANNAGTVYAFSYDLAFPSASNTISKTLPETTTLTGNEETAYGMWYKGYDGLSKYRSNLGSLSKIELRASANADNGGTRTNGSTIWFNATSTSKDFLDSMVIYHEFGHVWHLSNGWPSGATGSHSWTSPSNDKLAWTEGFANYVSTQLSGNYYSLDYGSTTFGGNLRDRSYYQGSFATPTWSAQALRSNYSENQQIELFTAHVLYSLRSSGYKTFAQIRDLTSPTKNSMRNIYETLISAASSSDKVKVWEIFEKGGCAYDLTLPVVSNLSRSGNIVICSATDNVGIAKYEWYANGVLKQTGSANTFSLTGLAGSQSIEVRVYDYEGAATGARPRTQRYVSKTMATIMSASALGSYEYELNENMLSNMNVQIENEFTLPVDSSEQYSISIGKNEDIYIYAHALGAIGGYTIIDPTGKLAYEVDYIAPDAPFVIENAMPGEWCIRVNALDSGMARQLVEDNYDAIYREYEESLYNEIARENSEQGTKSSKDESNGKDNHEKIASEEVFVAVLETINVPVVIELATRPTKVESQADFIWTANNSFLSDNYGDADIIVRESESGVLLNKNEPLSDGLHSIRLTRVSGSHESESIYLSIRVNANAPTIDFTYQDEDMKLTANNYYETDADCVFTCGALSDGVTSVKVNGVDTFIFSDNNIVINENVSTGENLFVIEMVDGVGNVSVVNLIINKAA